MMTGKKKEEKKKCSYEVEFPDYKCSREAIPGDEHCIFHSKDIEGKKDKFNDAFWKEFKRQKDQEETYDFTGFVFPGDISFTSKKFGKIATFNNAQFLGMPDFGRANFSGTADFSRAKFSREVRFARTIFQKKADFGIAQFSGNVSFWDAEFKGEAYFRNTQFSGEVIFFSAKFFGAAYFWSAQFFGKAYFGTAQFSGKIYFNKAKFKEEVDFENISLKKYNSFEMIDTYFYNVSGIFEYIENNDTDFKKLRMISKTLKTEFLPKNFRLILGEETTARHPIQSRQIRDDMYLLDKKERISKMSGIKRIWNKSFYFLWWLTADYGRSFKRWLLCCFVIIFIFGAIFADYNAPNWKPESFWHFFDEIDPQFQISPESRIPTWFTPYYFSIVTFTTLGFGDVTPLNLAGEIWLAIEVILGYIMLGGLISILANKLARRS
ncbi:MAG: pentapeptide repeat-containing protein [Candidatus Aminicenantes bacterium]|jgi:uncharacterized protein YjbI with pentapeptide repeats